MRTLDWGNQVMGPRIIGSSVTSLVNVPEIGFYGCIASIIFKILLHVLTPYLLIRLFRLRGGNLYKPINTNLPTIVRPFS